MGVEAVPVLAIPVGTSTNLLVGSLSNEAGYGAFSMFEFSRMGLILFATGVTLFLLCGRWLLPEAPAQELAGRAPLLKS